MSFGQEIRQIEPGRGGDIDEQQWPINVALVLLAAFVVGVVAAVSDFSDPRLLYNGWARLIGVGLTIAALFAGMTYLRRRMLRRVQLGVLLSLLFHLVLAFYLQQQYLRILAEEETRQSRQEQTAERAPITVPEYHWEQIERPETRQNFDEPVPTEDLVDSQPDSPTRSEVEHPLPIDERPEQEMVEPSRQQPNPAELRRAELSAPRRAEQAAGGQISRQPWKQQPVPNEPIPKPKIRPAGQISDRAALDQVASLQRRATRMPSYERRTFEQPSAERRIERVDMARRASSKQPLPDRPTTPTPSRRLTQIAEQPQTNATAPQPVHQPTRPVTRELNPSERSVARREAEAVRPTAQKQSVEPSPTTVAEVTQSAARHRRPDRRPELAQSPTTEPARRVTRVNVPTETPSPSREALAAATPQPSPSLQPAPSEVQRSEAGRVAQRPAARPSETPPIPSMTRRQQLPSAIARRAESRRADQPAQPSSTPSQPSTLARNVQGAKLPSTAMPVESNVALKPTPRGGSAPSRIEATSKAAAVTRSDVGAPQSQRIAAAGSVDLAVGQAQLEARPGQRRATSRGKPSVNPNADMPRIARATAGTSADAVPVPREASAASVAAASTSGGPPVPSIRPSNISAARNGQAALPTPKSIAGAGPSGTSGTSGQIEVAQLSRISRNELDPSGITGGGAPQPKRAEVGQGLAARLPSEAAPLLTASGGAGSEAGSPMDAQVRGEQRQVAGLPGSRRSTPASGAPVSQLAEQGSLPTAMARRSMAGQRQPESEGLRPREAATLARSTRGIDIPAAAEAAEQMPTPGAGGATELAGAAPSSLEPGPTATVQRTATAASPPADRSLASASADFSAAAALMESNPGQQPEGDAPQPSDIAGEDSETATEPVAGAARIERRQPGRLADAIGMNAAAIPAPSRQSGRQPMAETIAQIPASLPAAELPTEQTATGSPAEPLPSTQLASARQEAGLPDELIRRAVASDAAEVSGPAASTPGVAAGPRRLPTGSDDAPALAAAVGGGPMQRTVRAGLPRGLAEQIELEPIAAGTGSEAGEALAQLESSVSGELSRREGGLPVQIAALTGPGGLSFEPSLEVGIPSRRASRESEIVHSGTSRFVIERSGGEIAIDGTVNEPTAAFRQRTKGERSQRAQSRGGTEGTERAVEIGLDFLARIQFPNGHWSLHRLPPGVELDNPALGSMRADTAGTGLALLAYLGAGYTHLDDKHRTIVNRGIDWLVRNQKPNGDLFTGGNQFAHFYSHGIATIALCEAYGMTQDSALREPARRAIQFIVDTQHPTRGGWRYAVNEQGHSTEADTSVTGWQLMALKSAQMAGLDVPSDTLDGIEQWLELTEAPNAPGQFVYNPFASDTPQQRAGRHPNLAMTAEGMIMRMYLGTRRGDPSIQAGADYLAEHLPAVGTRSNPRRDCYYWYYATQAMFQMQDEYWNAWNDRMTQLLQTGQEQQGELAGSWHPMEPVPDRWGHAGGRIYVTAMHLLMLEVYYRHLPLYQDLSR